MRLKHFHYSFDQVALGNRPGSIDDTIKKLFSAWGRLCDEYAECWANTHPFSYNERVSISSLSAAARDAKLLPLEEVPTSKKSNLDEKSNARGRIDLLILDKESQKVLSFEAKQHFQSLTEKYQDLGKKIRRATKDADRNRAHKDEGVLRLDADAYFGISFFCPLIPAADVDGKNNSPTNMRLMFEKLVDDIRATKPTYLGWLLSKDIHNTLEGTSSGRVFYWPGVVVAITRAKNHHGN